MRSRNWPSLSRAPTPASGGREIAHDARSGLRHARGTTGNCVSPPERDFRPRAASPGAAASGPADRVALHAVGRQCIRRRWWRSPPPPLKAANQTSPTHRVAGLPETYTSVRPWFLIGSVRTGLPVAAYMAFSTAGAVTQIVGSPTPPQKS